MVNVKHLFSFLIKELNIDHFATEKTHIINRPTYVEFMENIKRIVLSIPL